MKSTQSSVASNVFSFAPVAAPAFRLSVQDMADIAHWREIAEKAGYNRITVAQAEVDDSTEAPEYVSLGREGEPWSRWGFARKGRVISAWCCLTGTDIGEFPSLAAAFQAVIPGARNLVSPEPALATGQVVIMRQLRSA